MNEESDLYTQNARDYAEQSEYWARRSQRAANQIDLPAAMLLTIGISLLLNCLLVSVAQTLTLQQMGTQHAQCQK